MSREPTLPWLRIGRHHFLQRTPWRPPSIPRELQALLLSHLETNSLFMAEAWECRPWNVLLAASFFLGLLESVTLVFAYRTLDYYTHWLGRLKKNAWFYCFYCQSFGWLFSSVPRGNSKTPNPKWRPCLITLFSSPEPEGLNQACQSLILLFLVSIYPNQSPPSFRPPNPN